MGEKRLRGVGVGFGVKRVSKFFWPGSLHSDLSPHGGHGWPIVGYDNEFRRVLAAAVSATTPPAHFAPSWALETAPSSPTCIGDCRGVSITLYVSTTYHAYSYLIPICIFQIASRQFHRNEYYSNKGLSHERGINNTHPTPHSARLLFEHSQAHKPSLNDTPRNTQHKPSGALSVELPPITNLRHMQPHLHHRLRPPPRIPRIRRHEIVAVCHAA